MLAYSCWVEPNLWTYLYPQRTASDPAFAAHRYTRMLAAFSGACAPATPPPSSPPARPARPATTRGCAPARSASRARSAAPGAGAYFDVFAHHPYPVAGNKDISPGAMPRNPDHTVWLANLGTLLEVFPGKTFYLSEFAYSTAYSMVFGVSVSQARQAAYLTASYRIAARYPQVELLTWFPRRTTRDNGSYTDRWGLYCGLRDLRGDASAPTTRSPAATGSR